MVVGEIPIRHQVVVVGAGPGGYTAALECATAGLDTAIVERDRIGGVCLNVGCIPSKALLHVADLVHRAAQGAALGVHAQVRVDLEQTQHHIQRVVKRLTGDVASLLDRARVTRYSGTARLIGPQRLVIDQGGTALYVEFDRVILATGSRPAAVPGLVVDGVHVHDSTSALAMFELPRRVAIVGGGYIGVELGTAFAKLGAEVTVVEASPTLLSGFPDAAARAVTKGLESLGVVVRASATAIGFEDGTLSLECARSGLVTVDVDAVVIAAGRRPNSDDLGLAQVGIAVDPTGTVGVDAARRTARAQVLAIGDLTEGPALAHKATAEAKVAALTAAGRRAAFDALVPRVVFSEPEVAAVGVSATEARRAGIEARQSRVPLRANGRALSQLPVPERGFFEVVYAKESGVVLGAVCCGPHAAELIGEVTLAIEAGLSVEDLALLAHPHPTYSELWADAATARTA